MKAAEIETGLIEGYGKRTLDDWIPQLRPFLERGCRVLDVGCGPGAITAAVARLVSPGNTVGVDPGEVRIGVAQQIAKKEGLKNLSFVLGDAHKLDFEDSRFDLAYSNTVLHSLIDPIAALEEQRRVVRPGGRVIAAGVRDWGFGHRHPSCPSLDKLEQAWAAYYETEQQRYFRGDRPAVRPDRQMPECAYFDLYAGRKCAEWFSRAGLSDLRVEATVFRVDHAGAEHMTPGGLDLLPWIGDKETPWAEVFPDVIAGGFADRETADAALTEVEEWYQRPDAFNLWAYLYVEGTA